MLGHHLAWTCVCPVHLCHHLCEFVCASALFYLEDAVSLVSYSHWLLQSFWFFFMLFSRPQGKGYDEKPYVGLGIQMYLTLCTWISCGSQHLFLQEEASQMLAETLVYEDNKMSLALILLLHTFSRIILCGFLLGPCLSNIRFSAT